MEAKNLYQTIIVASHRPVSYLKQTYTALIAEGIEPIVQYGSFNKQTLLASGIPFEKVKGIVKCNYPEWDELPVFERHNTNMQYALSRGLPQKDILLLEDDVVPCVNVKHQINCLYNMLKAYYPARKKYIIALYSTYYHNWGPQALLDYPPEKFYGLQACIYSHSVLDELSNLHAKNLHIPADMVTKEYAMQKTGYGETDLLFLTGRYSLFQHIGRQTSVNNNAFHRAENFLDGEKNPYLQASI